MIERKMTIPHQSIMKSEERLYHYIDSYHGWFMAEGNEANLKEFVRLFTSGGPRWVDSLLIVRDKIVGLFGLKTSIRLTEEEKHPGNIQLEPGAQIGIFTLLDKAENEIIVGEDDKHLNLRVSLFIEPKTDVTAKRELIITTCVKFNNLFGKMYFIPVKPFHQMIVHSTMKGIIRQLERSTEN